MILANLGLVPEIASSYTLQAAIGRQRASELMRTSRTPSAEFNILVDPEAAASLGSRGRDVWASRYRFDRIAEAVRDVVVEAAASAKAR